LVRCYTRGKRTGAAERERTGTNSGFDGEPDEIRRCRPAYDLPHRILHPVLHVHIHVRELWFGPGGNINIKNRLK
jgi:hypothetical protein